MSKEAFERAFELTNAATIADFAGCSKRAVERARKRGSLPPGQWGEKMARGIEVATGGAVVEKDLRAPDGETTVRRLVTSPGAAQPPAQTPMEQMMGTRAKLNEAREVLTVRKLKTDAEKGELDLSDRRAQTVAFDDMLSVVMSVLSEARKGHEIVQRSIGGLLTDTERDRKILEELRKGHQVLLDRLLQTVIESHEPA